MDFIQKKKSEKNFAASKTFKKLLKSDQSN